MSITTSSKLCSVALLEDKNVILEKHVINEKSHSQNLMIYIDNVLKDCNIPLQSIDLFACSNGPGSFTGVRIGVATIKAFSDITGKPIVPVSSLESLAYNAEQPLVCSLIDAKNDNVYFGLFENYESVVPFECKNINEILSFLMDKHTSSICFVGDGAIYHKCKILEKLPNSTFVEDDLNLESSISIGKCAFDKYKKGIYGNSNFITPLYLRKSQAERALEGEK